MAHQSTKLLEETDTASEDTHDDDEDGAPTSRVKPIEEGKTASAGRKGETDLTNPPCQACHRT